MTELNPDDLSDCVVIRAAAEYVLRQSAIPTPADVEAYAGYLAQMIRQGIMTMSIQEGLDPEANVGMWLVGTVDDGDERSIDLEDLHLPPGTLWRTGDG